MFQTKSIHVRTLLTVALCYFIYIETGLYTAFAFILIAFSLEFISWWMGQVNEILDILTDEKINSESEAKND